MKRVFQLTGPIGPPEDVESTPRPSPRPLSDIGSVPQEAARVALRRVDVGHITLVKAGQPWPIATEEIGSFCGYPVWRCPDQPRTTAIFPDGHILVDQVGETTLRAYRHLRPLRSPGQFWGTTSTNGPWV